MYNGNVYCRHIRSLQIVIEEKTQREVIEHPNHSSDYVTFVLYTVLVSWQIFVVDSK